MTNDKVSIIIPTYNRFEFLLNTIASIQAQTHKNIEIIVINDKSTQSKYYNHDWNDAVKVIHLKENTKKKFGFACAGYVRNIGIKQATGDYIAFCDDDDIWFPQKLELQLNAMKRNGCKMSSTDGLFGNGIYNSDKKYKKYNAEHYYDWIKKFYKLKGSNLMEKNENGFPKIWTKEFIKIFNCMICSSVIIHKSIVDKIGGMNNITNGTEDHDCWLRALDHTNSVYVSEVCFYYDNGHGNGQNY